MALFIKSELSETSKTLFTKKIEQWLSWTAHKDLKKLLKNPEESMKTLEAVEGIAHTPTNHHHYLAAVVAYLRHEKVKGIGEEVQKGYLAEWITIQRKNSEPIQEHYLESKPTERQADKADMKWPDILKVRDDLPIGQEKLLLGFYTYLDPVRADYYATQLVPEGKVAKEPNYILLKERKVVLTDFKTKGRYEKIEQTIPPELMTILEADLKERSRNYLFNPPTGGDTGYDRKQFSSWACRTLTRVLRHPMTLVVLRHLYISQMDLSKPLKELNETAKNMGHSVGMQKGYEWKSELDSIVQPKEEEKNTIISSSIDTLNEDSTLSYALQNHTEPKRDTYHLSTLLQKHYNMGSIELHKNKSLEFHISSPEIELYEIIQFMNNLSRSTTYDSAIYILALQNSKYYVGIAHTSYINKEDINYKDSNKYEVATKIRLNSHRDNGGGSSPANWTWIHPVVSVLAFIQGNSDDEDLITLLVSKCVGEDNVRGGKWTDIHKSPLFPKMTVEEIKAAIIKSSK